MKNSCLGILALLVLSACTTFSKKECQTMDWRQQGRQAAMDGKSYDQTQSYYQKECFAEHDVQPDDQALKSGYDDGLKTFCTPDFAYKFARQGGKYSGTCPTDKEKEVLPTYSQGRVKYLEDRVRSLESEVSDLESKVSSLQGDLSSAESRASSAESSLTSCETSHP